MGDLMTGMAIPAPAIDDFAASLTGSLLTADDDRYEDARKVWNGYIDRRASFRAVGPYAAPAYC